MSKRCKLQKEYYKEFGSYKGDGKYSNDYVKWLENEVLALRLYNVSQQRELLIDFMNKTQGNLIWGWNLGGGEKLADEYLKGNL